MSGTNHWRNIAFIHENQIIFNKTDFLDMTQKLITKFFEKYLGIVIHGRSVAKITLVFVKFVKKGN